MGAHADRLEVPVIAETTIDVSIKAHALKTLLKFIEKDLSLEQREAAFASLPPGYRQYTQKILLAADWLPFEVVTTLTEAAAKAKGEPLERFAERAGRHAANAAVNTIYQWLAFLKTPDYILSKAGRTFSTFYNRGSMEVERLGEKSAHVTLRDFPASTAACSRITGWMLELGEMTKAPKLQVIHTRCQSKGVPCCQWLISWE